MGAADSPCIGICSIDPQSRLCIGCWRTLAEISAWPRLSYKQRQELRAALAKRARQAKAAER